MRITKEALLKAARESAEKSSRRNRDLVCIYLTGSLLSETPLLGGTTDIDELISLCTHHHREHHRGEFTIEGNPNRPDGLVFKARYGWEIEPHIPDPVPPPRHAPPDQQPVRGWTMDSTLYLRPNKPPAPTDEY